MTMTEQQLAQTAERQLQQGRLEDAISSYEALLGVQPKLPHAWFNLGYARRCLRRFEPALEAYAAALDHGIDRPEEVHLNRAVILSEHLEREAEAEAALRQAVGCNRDFLLGWLNLGSLYEDLGRAEEAIAAYAEVLRRDPFEDRALARSAAIRTAMGRPDEAIALLREPMASPIFLQQAAGETWFSLGEAYDASARYDEAFHAYATGNERMRITAPQAYDRAAQERLVDRLIALFPESHSTADAISHEPLLFIVGMFRSGSTLAEQILARHSKVIAGGELEFVPALVAFRLQPYPEAVSRLGEHSVQALRQEYLQQLQARHAGTFIVTDKRPDNFLHIGLIKRLFPEARFVHTMRNPLDNLLSVFSVPFAEGVTYGWQQSDIAHFYCQYRRLMEHWQSIHGDAILHLDYDALVKDPEPQIRSMLEFCGLGWEETMLSPNEGARVVRTASVWQVRRPLHPRSSGRWRNYAAHLGEAREVLASCPNMPAGWDSLA